MHSPILQQEMLSVIHEFHRKGWSPATSTNYSFRNPAGDTYTISRSGVDKGAFEVTDFMEVDRCGEPLPGYEHLKPSAETLLHTLLYQQPDIRAVLHTHTVNNTVYSWKHRAEAVVSITGFELLKGISGISTHEAVLQVPIFANSQDMKALSEYVAKGLVPFSSTPGFLLAGHGLYAWGSSIAEAKRHVETFEFLFECLNMLER